MIATDATIESINIRLGNRCDRWATVTAVQFVT